MSDSVQPDHSVFTEANARRVLATLPREDLITMVLHNAYEAEKFRDQADTFNQQADEHYQRAQALEAEVERIKAIVRDAQDDLPSLDDHDHTLLVALVGHPR